MSDSGGFFDRQSGTGDGSWGESPPSEPRSGPFSVEPTHPLEEDAPQSQGLFGGASPAANPAPAAPGEAPPAAAPPPPPPARSAPPPPAAAPPPQPPAQSAPPPPEPPAAPSAPAPSVAAPPPPPMFATPTSVGAPPSDSWAAGEEPAPAATESSRTPPAASAGGGDGSDVSAPAGAFTVRDRPDDAPPVKRPLPFVAIGAAVALVLVAVGAVIFLTGGDDPVPVAVAGSTTIKRPSAPTSVVASVPADPAVQAAFDAEVIRACTVINADPGLDTETVMLWDANWAKLGKTERNLRDEINNCSLPARDRALASMGADQAAAIEARIASCTEPDVAALLANIDGARGSCVTIMVRVEAVGAGACQLDVVWDSAAKGREASFDGGKAILQVGDGTTCPQIPMMPPGTISKVWAEWKGATVGADGKDIPLLAAEEVG